MKSLGCVGIVNGGASFVDIDASKTVGELKGLIKKAKCYPFPAELIKLYVAKRSGKWLKYRDPDVQLLRQGEVSVSILQIMLANGEMDAADQIGDSAFGFPDEKDMVEGDIHIFVDIPEDIKTRLRQYWGNPKLFVPPALEIDSGLSLTSAWQWLVARFSLPTSISGAEKDK